MDRHIPVPPVDKVPGFVRLLPGSREVEAVETFIHRREPRRFKVVRVTWAGMSWIKSIALQRKPRVAKPKPAPAPEAPAGVLPGLGATEPEAPPPPAESAP